MLPLFGALTPRSSVFDSTTTDTVWNLGDLDSIDATAFFEENFITGALKVLLPEAFRRLEQGAESGIGIFHLSQSMGGGKTHSLLALGLLARNPSLRAAILKECGYEGGELGEVRVVPFTGGAIPTPNGLWGYIAEHKAIDKPEALKNCYSPLRAPSESE